MEFRHLATYGRRKRDDEITSVKILSETEVIHIGDIIDLRKGAASGKLKTRDYAVARDGRVLRRLDDDYVVVQRDGKQVKLALETEHVARPIFLDSAVLIEDSEYQDQEAAIFDTSTGKLRARLKGHAKDENKNIAPWFHTPDGKTLWSSDGKTIRCFDVTTVKETLAIPIDKKQRSMMVSTTPAGDVVVTLRPAKGDRDDDRLVLLDRTGKEKAAAKLETFMGFARVGDHIVVFEDATQQFVILDFGLEEVGRVPMPVKDNYAEVIPLWSGKEWIAVDGHGQFHHFGPASLKPGAAKKK